MSEKTRHINNFTIENFKAFDKFELDACKQFNLILGDNNVGKTSALEALIFDKDLIKYINNLQGLLEWRRIFKPNENRLNYSINPLSFFVNSKSDISKISLKVEYEDGNEVKISYETVKPENLTKDELEKSFEFLIRGANPTELIRENINGKVIYASTGEQENLKKTSSSFVNFVASGLSYGTDLIDFYTRYFQSSQTRKNELIYLLKTIIEDIEDIEIDLNHIKGKPIIGIRQKNNDTMLPLPMFGNGVIKLFRLIMEISVCKNGHLCIDDIDSEFHYSRYDDVVRTVFSIAKRNNVQLFMTTHNVEFLKSIKNVLEQEEMKSLQEKINSYTLERLPNGSIKAFGYTFDEFEFALKNEHELRGRG